MARKSTQGAPISGPFLAGLDNAFFNGRNVIFGDYPADDGIHKFETGTPGKGLHNDPAVAVLAVSAGLFLVFALDADFLFDGFPVGNFWGFEQDFDIKFSFEFFDGALDVDLTQAGKQNLLGFRIALQP